MPNLDPELINNDVGVALVSRGEIPSMNGPYLNGVPYPQLSGSERGDVSIADIFGIQLAETPGAREVLSRVFFDLIPLVPSPDDV